jgi:hypothetical protein
VNKIPDGLAQRVTRFLHFTYHERSANSEELSRFLGMKS